MIIEKKKNGAEMTILLKGRLDTSTAPVLETELQSVLPQTESLIFDFTDLEYISSAGLRILLTTQKAMMKQGQMKVSHVNEEIMQVFEITGFADFLTIE